MATSEARRHYNRRYYEQNKARHKAQAAEYRAANRERLRDEKRRWMANWKAGRSCEECGQAHPAALVFHHRDPASKEFDISKGVTKGYSSSRIAAEIEKCQVLCRSCHAILHWNLTEERGTALHMEEGARESLAAQPMLPAMAI